MAKFSADRLLRRIFPSISRLTFNPVIAGLLDVSDLPVRLAYSRARQLPPNRFRCRVGVGNALFNNHLEFFAGPPNLWLSVFADGFANLGSTIIDIGSGCGRQARVLRDFSENGQAFTGQYVGVDIDPEMVAWCAKHFPAETFRFHLSTDASASYKNAGSAAAPYSIPEPSGSADFVFSRSLFTHLLEHEAMNYLAETHRLLKPGGVGHHAVFCLDYPPPTMGKRHTFSHRIGRAAVESLSQPTAAVAYTEEDLFDMARAAGFSDMHVRHHPQSWQPSLILRKAADA